MVGKKPIGIPYVGIACAKENKPNRREQNKHERTLNFGFILSVTSLVYRAIDTFISQSANEYTYLYPQASLEHHYIDRSYLYFIAENRIY